MIELSKSDKKAARILIDTGLDREYAHGLKKASAILEDWLKGNRDSRDAYMKLYKQVTGYDRHIAKRYNDLTGSRYLITVIGLLFDEVISEDELHGFSDNTKEFIVEATKKLKD
jgi:hypothetical protein